MYECFLSICVVALTHKAKRLCVRTLLIALYMHIECGQPTAFDPLLCKFKFSDKVAPTMCSTNFHANINTDIKPNFLLLKGPEQQLNIIYIN